jgi:hypothetical protein
VGLELGDIVLFELVGSEMTVTNKFEMAHSGPVLTLLFIVKTPPGYPRTHIQCTVRNSTPTLAPEHPHTIMMSIACLHTRKY